MKKLFIILTVFFFSIASFAQERELSDYEKYRLEKESKEYSPEDEIECWAKVEEMPQFNGAEPKEFRKWISLNVEYPEHAIKNDIQGKVMVHFIINTEGDVVNVSVVKSVDEYLDAEAIRVVKISPKWTPGKQDGVPVNVEFTFPINFVLDRKTEVDEKPMVINNYYIDDYPNYRHSLYFGYSPGFYGYNYYDPFYYGGWYGYNTYYYGSYYPYWGYNPYYSRYYGYHHHHNYWNYGYYSRPGGNYYTNSNGYYKTYKNGYVNPPTARKKNVRTQPITTRTAATRANSTTRNYTPKYTKPRTTSRPEYNRSATRNRVTTQQRATQQRSTTVHTPASTQRSTYNRPSSTKSRSSYTRPSTTSRSTYSRPSSPARSSSTYSRSSSSYSGSRSASSGRSYSSGSASRGSGSRSSGKK